ncbi:MAG: transcriptional regulator Spx [Bacillota bacterium]|nr:transcriptional regulator Spx [Bacillota bacterium]
MVILYTSPGCASCRKAKQWLKENEIQFVEKNIFTTLLDGNEIKYILSRSENGTDDIISVRSKAFQSLNKDIEDYTIEELIELIQKNPSIMKRPIMINEKNFVVGYDDDEITKMVSSNVRNLARCCDNTCPNYELCGSIREVRINT